jgi:hypothetical protein
VGAAYFGYNNASGNNGNVLNQGITPGAGVGIAQTNLYDRMNCLTAFQENGVALQTFDYDRWGNGWLVTSALPVP